MNRACIDELRRAAVVHPDVRSQAGWLWDILYSLDDEKRAKYYRLWPIQMAARSTTGYGLYSYGHAKYYRLWPI